MDRNLFFGIQWVHHLIAILPLTLYFIKNGQKIDRNNLLKIYLIVSFLYEMTSIYTEQNSIQDHWIVNSFIVVEFALLSEYIIRLLRWQHFNAVFRGLQVLVAIICLYNFGIEKDFLKINNNVKSSAAIVLIILSLLYYYNLLKNTLAPNLLADPYFWIITAVFFFFCTTFIYSIYSREVMWAEKIIARQLYLIVMIFSIFYRSILAISLWNTVAHNK
jgi:hypothetical protein